MAARRWELSALVATNSAARTTERPNQTISRRNDRRTHGTTPDHEATSTTCLLAGLDRLCASISATMLSLRQVSSREASSSRTLAGHVSGRTVGESRSRPYRTSSSLHQRLPVYRHYNRLLHQMGGGLSCPLAGREHGGRVLVEQVFTRFGCPRQLLSDQGPCFEAALFQNMCQLMNIEKIRTTAYKPSSNGRIERFHRTLNTMIAKLVSQSQRSWDLHLPYVMSAYRSTEHESTHYTPCRLFLGREVVLPVDLVLSDCRLEAGSPVSVDDF